MVGTPIVRRRRLKTESSRAGLLRTRVSLTRSVTLPYDLLRVRKVMSAERGRLRRNRARCGRDTYQPDARARDAGQGPSPMHSRSPRSRVGLVWGQHSGSASRF